MPTRGVLLDRDGVVVENLSGYVKSVADVVFIPGSIDAVATLASNGYLLAIVTNQACVGRGVVTLEEAQTVQEHIVGVLAAAAGVPILSYLCPHDQQAHCMCRKPMPGMLQSALMALDASAEESWIIGDAASDLQAGRAIGASTILVRTGRGMASQSVVGTLADHVADDLSSAATWLMRASRP